MAETTAERYERWARISQCGTQRRAYPWLVQLEDAGTGHMVAWSFVRCRDEAEAQAVARAMRSMYPERYDVCVWEESPEGPDNQRVLGTDGELHHIPEVEVVDDVQPWEHDWIDMGMGG